MKKKYIGTLMAVFVLLSIVSLLISSVAPLRVHAVDITAFFLSFVVPGLLAFYIGDRKKQMMVWILGGTVGLFVWDVGSTIVIVKHDLFMGWYILYPSGLAGVVLLQFVVKYISGKATL